MKTLFLYFLIAINFAVIAMPKDSFYVQEENTVVASQSIKNTYEKGLDFLSKENFEDAFTAISSGLKSSLKINNENLIATGYLHLGSYFIRNNNNSKALENLNTSLKLFL